MLRPGTELAAVGKPGADPASPTAGAMPTNAKAARAALSKKATTVRGGLLGSVKQRIFTDMLDSVSGNYNILICDNKGAEILSICVRMHDLMDHGVTLVEDLSMPRQPVLSSAAIYLIEPTEESVRRVMQDWSVKNMYREAHVYFTSPASDNLVQLMATEPRLVEALKTLKDMLLDFAVPETLLFSFDMFGDIPKLFPPDVALSGGRENILGQTARRLISVFFALGAGVPSVRYQGTSRLAQQVARLFQEQVSATTRNNPSAFRLASGNPGGEAEEPPLLILVDRSFDAVEPLMHERTYQCLLNDLMPLENGIYQQKFEGRSGQEGVRSCLIDEQDPYWCQYRHRFFPVCLEEIPRKLQELIAANPALANGMSSSGAVAGGGNKLASVGSAIRALPEFQERQAKLSVHIDICTKIMDLYKQQKLGEVCEVEQDMATGRRSFKEVYDVVHRLAADVSLPLPVRARLILLLCAATNTREFTEAKKLMLLQECGLSNEADRCNSLNMFISRMGQLPQEKADGAADGGDKAAAAAKGGTLGSLMRRSLRNTRGAKADGPSSPAGSPNRAGGGITPDSYRNQAYLILNAATNNSLSLSDFPLFTGASGAGLANMANAGRGGGAGGGGQRRTLRGAAAAAAGGADTLNRGGPAAGFGGETNLTLDLGHEGQYALRSRQRVVLFVLGGVTYGEARAAYEISQLSRTEIVVGGTSLLTPAKFLSALTSLR